MAAAQAGSQTPIRRGISQSLTDRLFEEDEETPEEQRPIRPQDSRTDNRERFQRNERSAARAVFDRTRHLVCFIVLVTVVLVVAAIYFYAMGWVIWSRHHEKPCDQHLALWLLVSLLLPVLAAFAECCSKRLKLVLQLSSAIAFVVGVVLFYNSKTCAETNPELYTFVKHYLIFMGIMWACTVILPLILLGVIVYGMRNGWFDDVNGAKPETIKNLETVTFDAALFAEEGKPNDNRPPGECCCCNEAFDGISPIKRTPCQHYFHEECLGKWLKVAFTCPLCRNDLDEAVDSGGAAA